ncbi:MAG TPA: helix-turn-helix transcriptional regulator [Pseudonocardiaceae bacterium]|nr:helix-turn-helix transcriptional regulator [Pseudonocardiaceae bacterium]
MVTEGPIGERIRIYRRRRGLGQKELAGLVGRSESWLSQVERGIRSVDRLSVLIDIARVLKTDVETLAGYRMALAPNGGADLDGLEAIRDALGAYPGLGLSTAPASTLDEIEQLTTEVHQRYQAADYGAAARLLPGLITASDTLAADSRGDALLRASAVQSQVYVAAAKLVTKVGDGHLAWLAADRATTAALRAESESLKAMAAYQVACAFLKLDRLDQAEHIALRTAENSLDDTPTGLSVQGALFLIGAVIAGRRSDRPEATERLRRAHYLADALGTDANYGWTAFGPTNVAIHHVSTAAELGDAQHAVAQAETIDTTAMPPGLLSRRAQVHIDTAWAYSQHHNDPAVIINLLEAERVAPQTLRYNVIVRELLRELLKRERRSATPGLRALAERSGVLH